MSLMKIVKFKPGQKFHTLRLLEIKNLFSYLKPKPKERILDVGCGAGYFCSLLAKRGVSPYGIDPNKESIKKAKKTYPKINFVTGYGEKLPYKKKSFDKVVSVCVMEHVQDDDKMIFEVNRLLKERGLFVFSVDSLSSPHMSSKYKQYHKKEYLLNQLYTLNKIKNKLEKGGFGLLEHRFLFNSWISTKIILFASRYHFGRVYQLLFPIIFPIMRFETLLTSPLSGFILVLKARKI